jgi:hypothetical protein
MTQHVDDDINIWTPRAREISLAAIEDTTILLSSADHDRPNGRSVDRLTVPKAKKRIPFTLETWRGLVG